MLPFDKIDSGLFYFFSAGSYLLGFLLLIALEFSFVGSGLSFVNQFERAGMRQAFVCLEYNTVQGINCF